MNIILVPEGVRKGRTASFTHRHIMVMATVGVLLLPTVLGVVSYRIYGMLSGNDPDQPVAQLQLQQAQLQSQRQDISRMRRRTEDHLNALAQRLGRLQAQVIRLNAMGARMTRMAGLDSREFDFSKKVALGGGPAQHTGTMAASDLSTLLTTLDEQLAKQTEQLSALQTVLISHQTLDAITPTGWPVSGGWVSSHFGLRADPFTGRRAHHRGVDIASPLGSNIGAMGDGVITYAGKRAGYGLMVEITHGQGLVTRYAHASKVLVNRGDRVSRGHAVAQVGISGRSTGPHLHFEVLRRGRHLDPANFLNRNKTAITRSRSRTPSNRT